MAGSISQQATPASLDPGELMQELDRFRTALVDQAARRCADAGWTTIALYAAGAHTRRYLCQPWRWRGIRVAAVLDDRPPVASIDGVPVVRPEDLPAGIDAVVVSSDTNEPVIYRRALDAIDGRAPVLRIYGDPPPLYEPDLEPSIERLRSAGVSGEDAAWLAENRAERHDASFDSLPIRRTEMHLRRYLLAARYAQGAIALDAACGTGYGAELLAASGADHVTGIDIDECTIAYANRYHAHGRVSFHTGDATNVPLPDAAARLITSFETIEHLQRPETLVAEFARVLAPGGTLVLSTPNDRGTTDFHEVSLTQNDLDTMLETGFRVIERLGQLPGNDPIDTDLPPGIYRRSSYDIRPETLIVVAERR